MDSRAGVNLAFALVTGILVVFGAWVQALPIKAQSVARDDHFEVGARTDVGVITFAELHANDDPGVSSTDVVRLPLFAGLQELGQELELTPTAGFRTLGADAFAYAAHFGVKGEAEPSTATVHLLATRPQDLLLSEGFEPNQKKNYEVVAGGHTVVEAADAAIVGEQGLRVETSSQGASGDAYVRFQLGSSVTPLDAKSGGSTMPGKIDCGGGDGDEEGFAAYMPAGQVAVITAGPPTGPAGLRLVLSTGGEGRQVRAEIWDEVDGAYHATPWTDVVTAQPRFEMRLWEEDPEGLEGLGGTELKVDGRFAGRVSGIRNASVDFSEVRLGIQQIDGGRVDGVLRFDEFRVWAAGGETPVDLELATGFEPGNVPSGLQVVGTGATISSQGALTGARGLLVDLAQGASWMAATPAQQIAEAAPAERTAVRFGLDATKAELAEGASLQLLRLPQADGKGHLELVLDVLNGGQRLAARAFDGKTSTAPVPLSDSEHTVILEWRAASGPQALDGTLRLWLDGALVAEALDLGGAAVELGELRLGAASTSSVASGVLKIDDVAMWH